MSATDSSDLKQSELGPSFHFSQEFKDHLEDLVFEILKEKPRDPLQYAFNFFSKRLQSRKGINDRKECVIAYVFIFVKR